VEIGCFPKARDHLGYRDALVDNIIYQMTVKLGHMFDDPDLRISLHYFLMRAGDGALGDRGHDIALQMRIASKNALSLEEAKNVLAYALMYADKTDCRLEGNPHNQLDLAQEIDFYYQVLPRSLQHDMEHIVRVILREFHRCYGRTLIPFNFTSAVIAESKKGITPSKIANILQNSVSDTINARHCAAVVSQAFLTPELAFVEQRIKSPRVPKPTDFDPKDLQDRLVEAFKPVVGPHFEWPGLGYRIELLKKCEMLKQSTLQNLIAERTLDLVSPAIIEGVVKDVLSPNEWKDPFGPYSPLPTGFEDRHLHLSDAQAETFAAELANLLHTDSSKRTKLTLMLHDSRISRMAPSLISIIFGTDHQRLPKIAEALRRTAVIHNVSFDELFCWDVGEKIRSAGRVLVRATKAGKRVVLAPRTLYRIVFPC
jgi:hypothetical protein